MNKARISKDVQIQRIMTGDYYTHRQLHIYGTDALFHKGFQDGNTYHQFFPVKQNIVLDYYLMRAKSARIQANQIRLIKGLVQLGYEVRIFIGYISGADSTPKVVKATRSSDSKQIIQRAVWIDKRTHKSVYNELNQVRRAVHNKIRHKNGIYDLVGRIENPHHLSKANHIYSHGHYHFMMALVGKPDDDKAVSSKVAYLKHVFEKSFIKVFGYKPSHCKNTIQPLHYLVKVKGMNIFKMSKFHMTLCGKLNHHYNKAFLTPKELEANKYAVAHDVVFSPKVLPKVSIKEPRHYVSNNLYYQGHLKPFTNDDSIKVSQNGMGFLALGFYDEYLCQDYRIQVKDSDDLVNSTKLSRSQKRLMLEADLQSSPHSSVINSMSSRSIDKILEQALNTDDLGVRAKSNARLLSGVSAVLVHSPLTKRDGVKNGSKAHFQLNKTGLKSNKHYATTIEDNNNDCVFHIAQISVYSDVILGRLSNKTLKTKDLKLKITTLLKESKSLDGLNYYYTQQLIHTVAKLIVDVETNIEIKLLWLDKPT